MANTKALIGIGIGVGIIGLLAWASPAESKIVVNKGPAPPLPPRRPVEPPARRPGDLGPAPGSIAADAIEAAIAAAQGAGAGLATPGTAPQSGMLSGLLLPNPAPLVQGQRYKSRLELTGLEAYGSRAQIKSTFEGLGFANATVYMTQSELPASGGTSPWPGLALANVTSGSRWAEGTWNQPSQAVPTPSQIKYAWTA